MKNPWIIIAALVVLLFGGSFWYASVSSEKNNEGVEIISHTKGNSNAVVTLVEYSDLECPACRDFQPTLNQVLDEYGDSLFFEYKHFPLPIHRYALQASVAAEAAGQQGKFFEYHDLLFANQDNWSSSPTPQVLFVQYAEELGLDIEMFRRHMNSSLLREHVQNHFAEGRTKEVTGTPTFYLNDQKMNFRTYDEFVQQIEAVVNGEAPVVDTSTDIEFGI